MNREVSYFKQFFISVVIGFTILFIASLIWNIRGERQTTYELAKVEAEGNFNKDLTFRKWTATHGGVYVTMTDSTIANPYLNFLPNRDITTTNGTKLTLINPAYMNRLVFKMSNKKDGEFGHICSITPLHPDNKADEWEEKALNLFAKGTEEYYSPEQIDGKEYLRYIKPIRVENGCLKCHAQQGYSLNDIKGGVSISIPMDKYKVVLKTKINSIIFNHAIIFFLTFIIGALSYRRILKVVKQRDASRMKAKENEAKLKEQNNKLIWANEKAIESDRLKTIFIQNMSHEIRTPMNAILGFSSLLPDEFDNKSKLTEYTKIITQRGNDLMFIINDLLDISKIESKNMNVNIEPINLKDLFSELLPLFHEIQKRNLKSHVKLILPTITEEIILYTDKGKLKQILTNLVGNAFKFTHEGEIEIDLLINSPKLITFSVKDTGIGIPTEKLNSIFDRFSQVEQSSSRIYGGTGLGLSIVKGLISKLNGEIYVISEINKGSKFYFTLPYSKQNLIETQNNSTNNIYSNTL